MSEPTAAHDREQTSAPPPGTAGAAGLSPAGEPVRGMSPWMGLAILMTLAFLNYMDRNLVYPLLPLISRELGIPVDQLGALATGFHVVYACSAPLVGAISDRLARKTVLLIALVTWSVITALSGTAQGFLSLLVWRSLTGLGEGGYFPTAVSLIGDMFRSNRRGLAIALHGVCTTLGGSAGYAVGGYLGERHGWRMPFFLAVVPGLLLALVLYRGFVEPPRGAQEASDPHALPRSPAGDAGTGRRPYWRIVLSPAVLLIAVAACLGGFAMNGLNTFLPLYLNQVRGVSVTEAGVLTGIGFGATLIGQLSGGTLSDRLVGRVGAVRPLFVALPYVIAAPFITGINLASTTLLALGCYGVGPHHAGFGQPNIYGTIIDAVPAEERGSAQGFLLMLTFAGSSAAGWGGGLLIRKFGFDTTLYVLAAASALAGTFAAVLVQHLRSQAPKAQEGATAKLMRIAITGASGHLGVNLVRHLAARGQAPRVLVHREERTLAGLPVEPVRASVLDPGSLEAAFAGVELVYHLAARISIDPREDAEVMRINADGTRHVVEACLAARVSRLCHVSSIHALRLPPTGGGWASAQEPELWLAHDSPHGYDRSKAAGERAVAEAAARGLDAVVVNPTGIIGPHDHRPSMMGEVLVDLYRGRVPALVQGGFDWVDARDVAAGAVAAATGGRSGGRYLLSGHYATVGALARLVHELGGRPPPRLELPLALARLGVPLAMAAARLLGQRPLFTYASLDALDLREAVCHERAARALGYAPRPLGETVRDTLAWFREAGRL